MINLKFPHVQSHTEVTFSTSVNVLSYYPPISVGIKLQLTDKDTGRDVVCQTIPAKLI